MRNITINRIFWCTLLCVFIGASPIQVTAADSGPGDTAQLATSQTNVIVGTDHLGRPRPFDATHATEAAAVLPPEALANPRQAPHKTVSTLISDGFEGTFPGTTWSLWHPSSGAASVDWGKSSYRKASGTYSIWCAGSGSASPGAGGQVPVNTQSWVIAGPFDLSSATTGTLSFDFWLSTELNYDNFKWLASLDGSSFSGLQTSTSTSGFAHVDQDLSDWGSAGSLLGQAQVWIAFIYQSDESNTFEGAYVDNVSLTSDGGGGSSCGTYVITDDNDNNSFGGTADNDWNYCLYNTDSKHPIEFHVDITEASASSAQLLLLCNDVDEDTDPSNPEIDKVYVNNTFLGNLTGADGQDSTTVLNVPLNSLIVGRNTVRIDVNQAPSASPGDWCVELKQAQLIIDGGCAGSTTCRSVTTDQSSYAPGDTVRVTYEIDTSQSSQQIRVESNLVSPDGIIVAGVDNTYTTSGSSNDAKTVSLALPSGAAGGTYSVQILVFDVQTGQLDTSCPSRTFTVTGGGSGCTVSCSASVPATAQVGATVTLQGSATTSGCAKVEHFWFPDSNNTATIFDNTATWVYDAPGTYTWSYVVIADDQRCEKTGTITVTGSSGCTVSCSANVPATAQVGATVTLQGSATTSGCAKVEHFWFPDSNNTATIFDNTATWVYDAPGTYTWSYVVIADDQRCEKTGTITVTGGGGGTCTYSYWVAVASRANGSNNSFWSTDAGLFNRGSATASIEVRFYGTNRYWNRNIYLNPGNQSILSDVVGWINSGLTGSGALQVCSTQPLTVTSRTYNRISGGAVCFPTGTLGQSIDGFVTTRGASAGQTVVIPHLNQSSVFRTNIGYTNTGTTNANLTVRLYRGNGTLVGTYNVNLPPGQWKQANQPFYNTAGITHMEAGSVTVTVNSGSGIFVYGSLVDNVTNDPTTIWMK